MKRSNLYTVLFTVVVCGVCSIGVTLAAVMLRPAQEINKRLDRQMIILRLAGLVAPDAPSDAALADDLFKKHIRTIFVKLEDGSLQATVPPKAQNPRSAAKDPELGRDVAENPAKVRRVPVFGQVFLVQVEGKLDEVILPISGMGLWSTLYGYLALAPDGDTIKGISYYEHAETPGLGGEVDNPRWRALWPGRKVLDSQGKLALTVIKGQAGPAAADPNRVDGLSGATITSRGVEHMVRFWLSDQGYQPFLARLKKGEIQ
jgi:Na+-transporting NADH:ubiquinone oxidoreductase subunit C